MPARRAIRRAVRVVFEACAEGDGLGRIADVFSKGVKIGVAAMLPSSEYAKRLTREPRAWEKAPEVNAGERDAIPASCVEFVLAGLYAGDRISRPASQGRATSET